MSSNNRPPPNPPSPWVWDYAGRQWLLHDTSRRCWVDENLQPVGRTPQTTPGGPSGRTGTSTSNTPGTSVANTGANVASIERSLQNVSIGAAQSRPAVAAAYRATATDKTTGAETLWDVSETRTYTDPSNTESTRSINVKRIRQPENRKSAKSITGYKISREPLQDYRPGRVIEVALVPPDPNQTPSTVSRITPSPDLPYGNRIPRRRFVISQCSESRGSFTALAIKTYNGQGVAARGAIKSHHAVIYTSTIAPTPGENEQPTRNESGMQTNPIKVETFDRATALDPKARLDYMDTYEFDFGVANIRPWGRIAESSAAAFYAQHHQVYQMVMGANVGPTQAAGAGAAAGGALSSAASTTNTITAANPGYAPARGVAPTSRSSISYANPATSAGTSASASTAEAQFRTSLAASQDYARKNGLTIPTASTNQVYELARDAQKQRNFFANIRRRWRKERGERETSSDSD